MNGQSSAITLLRALEALTRLEQVGKDLLDFSSRRGLRGNALARALGMARHGLYVAPDELEPSKVILPLQAAIGEMATCCDTARRALTPNVVNALRAIPSPDPAGWPSSLRGRMESLEDLLALVRAKLKDPGGLLEHEGRVLQEHGAWLAAAFKTCRTAIALLARTPQTLERPEPPPRRLTQPMTKGDAGDLIAAMRGLAQTGRSRGAIRIPKGAWVGEGKRKCLDVDLLPEDLRPAFLKKLASARTKEST